MVGDTPNPPGHASTGAEQHLTARVCNPQGSMNGTALKSESERLSGRQPRQHRSFTYTGACQPAVSGTGLEATLRPEVPRSGDDLSKQMDPASRRGDSNPGPLHYE